MATWVKLAELSQFHDRNAIEVEYEGRIYALFRVGDQICAIDGICAHQGGPLAEGDLVGNSVTCPWHGWQFDLTDGRCRTGRSASQTVYGVRLEGEDVLVEVP